MLEWLAWGGVLVVAAILLIVVNVRAADSDSGLHIGLVERLNTLPVSRWIAPEWWGLWGFEGLYREHPIGILIPPLILAKLGFPASQAPFLANAIYQVLSLVIIQHIAATVVTAVEARALAWMLQLIDCVHLSHRANHEQAVLLLFLWRCGPSKIPQGCPLDRLLVFHHCCCAGEGRVCGLAIYRMCGMAPDHQE